MYLDIYKNIASTNPIKVKTCPFCGGDFAELIAIDEYGNEIIDDNYEGDVEYCIVCDSRNGGCGSSTPYTETQEEALMVWNTRLGK